MVAKSPFEKWTHQQQLRLLQSLPLKDQKCSLQSVQCSLWSRPLSSWVQQANWLFKARLQQSLSLCMAFFFFLVLVVVLVPGPHIPEQSTFNPFLILLPPAPECFPQTSSTIAITTTTTTIAVVQLTEFLPSEPKALCLIPSRSHPGHPWLHSELEASLGYMETLSQNKNKVR